MCGEKTEIYSRITGYYRPVQNWNEGKMQEFKDRVTYDVQNSVMKRPVAGSMVTVDGYMETEETAVHTENTAAHTEETAAHTDRMLFVTDTCPNCRIAKNFLEGMSYQVINASEHPELTKRYGVRQAPTLIVLDETGMHRFANASNIKKYVDHAAV